MAQLKAPVNVTVKDEVRVASASCQRPSALARVEAKPKKRSSSSEGNLQPHLVTPVTESAKVKESNRL